MSLYCFDQILDTVHPLGYLSNNFEFNFATKFLKKRYREKHPIKNVFTSNSNLKQIFEAYSKIRAVIVDYFLPRRYNIKPETIIELKNETNSNFDLIFLLNYPLKYYLEDFRRLGVRVLFNYPPLEKVTNFNQRFSELKSSINAFEINNFVLRNKNKETKFFGLNCYDEELYLHFRDVKALIYEINKEKKEFFVKNELINAEKLDLFIKYSKYLLNNINSNIFGYDYKLPIINYKVVKINDIIHNIKDSFEDSGSRYEHIPPLLANTLYKIRDIEEFINNKNIKREKFNEILAELNSYQNSNNLNLKIGVFCLDSIFFPFYKRFIEDQVTDFSPQIRILAKNPHHFNEIFDLIIFPRSLRTTEKYLINIGTAKSYIFLYYPYENPNQGLNSFKLDYDFLIKYFSKKTVISEYYMSLLSFNIKKWQIKQEGEDKEALNKLFNELYDELKTDFDESKIFDDRYLDDLLSKYQNKVKSYVSNKGKRIFLVFEDGSEDNVFENQGVQVIIRNDDKIDVQNIFAKDLQVGFSVVYFKNSINASIFQIIFDRLEENPDFFPIIKKSKYWQAVLQLGFTKHNDSIESLHRKMNRLGSIITRQTLRNWVLQKTIGPSDWNNLTRIGKIYGDKLLEENPKIFDLAIRKIRGIHRAWGRRIRKMIINKVTKQFYQDEDENIIDEQYGIYINDIKSLINIKTIKKIRSASI